MVASRQVDIPFHRGVGRQRGRGFGARCTCKSYWENCNSFLSKYNVPAAECVDVDLLEFAAPEIAEAVSGRRNFKTAAKIVGRQTLKKQFGSDSMKRTASRVTPTKSAKQVSW